MAKKKLKGTDKTGGKIIDLMEALKASLKAERVCSNCGHGWHFSHCTARLCECGEATE